LGIPKQQSKGLKLPKMKLLNVHGILMSVEEQMKFDKWISNKGIAMNTKTPDERLAIALEFLDYQDTLK